MSLQDNPPMLDYNGHVFSQTDVQGMLDDKEMYRDADNLPKWIAIKLREDDSHPTYEVALRASWAFLTVFAKI